MTICIDIPADVESALRDQFGSGLEVRAKQDLAVSWFRDGRLTSRQVAALLGMSLFEAHAFLKSRGATLPMSLSDVEADLADLHKSHGS
jgi:predicted HTH domain antitoxin